MNTTEYKIIVPETETENTEQRFNALGAEGWHLVSVESAKGDPKNYIAYFKRYRREAAFPVPVRGREADLSSADTPELLSQLLPHCRRREKGGGYYGSISYLAKRLGVEVAKLRQQLQEIGIRFTSRSDEKLHYNSLGSYSVWVTEGDQGEVWFNAVLS